MKVILTEQQLLAIIKEEQSRWTYRPDGPRPGQSNTGSRDGGVNGGVGGSYIDTDYGLPKDGPENHFKVMDLTKTDRRDGVKSNYGVQNVEPNDFVLGSLSDFINRQNGGNAGSNYTQQNSESMPNDSQNSGDEFNNQGANNELNNVRISREGIQGKLMQALNWKSYQAGALCAIIEKESGFNTHAINEGEMFGTHKKSSASAGRGLHSECNYGAGLIQWSFYKRKLNAIIPFITEICPNEARSLGRVKAAEYWLKLGASTHGKRGGIENLSEDMQIKLIAHELTKGSYNKLGATVRNTKTPEEALATLYCYYVAGSKNSSTPATAAQAEKLARKYMSVNGKGESGFKGRLNALNQKYLA